MQIAQMIDFTGVVADIGGGKGQLLQRIAEKNSNVTQCILFDLQQVQDNVLLQDAVITQVAGSFFDPIQIKADTFYFKSILMIGMIKSITNTVQCCSSNEAKICVMHCYAVIDRCPG